MGNDTGIDMDRPVVMIRLSPPVPSEAIRQILWGLEEEGIPAECVEIPGGLPVRMAKQAAMASRLNVGIGIDGAGKTAVLHHRDLPGEKALIVLSDETFREPELRRLGMNAARLVKGNPLTFGDESGSESRSEGDGDVLSPDRMDQLVSSIVEAVLKNRENGRSP